jgi:hypothetical protein
VEESLVNSSAGGAAGDSDLSGIRIGGSWMVELQSPAAQGGMGQIWIAWMHDPARPRRVAVKVIRSSITSDLSRELFMREIEMHDRVRDVPGVIPLIDKGELEHPVTRETVYYFIMEWVENARPLHVACERLRLDERLKLFLTVSDTMDVVHKRAIVHCDLKPENILVDQEGRPWIMDFGLAISTRSHERMHTGWDVGSLRGTRAYMGPEQRAKDADPYSFTPALDVYALGVSLLQCLGGRVPFSDGDEDPKAPWKRPRVPFRLDGRVLPWSLRNCLQKSLAARPEDRYVDAGRMAEAVRGIIRHPLRRDLLLATLLALTLILLSTVWVRTTTIAGMFGQWWEVARHKLVVRPLELKHTHLLLETRRVVVDSEGNRETLMVSGNAAAKHIGLEHFDNLRCFFAASIDRLRELGVKSLGLSQHFFGPPLPTAPGARTTPQEATAMLLKAIRDFEDAGGTVTLLTYDWRAEPGQVFLHPDFREFQSPRHEHPGVYSIVNSTVFLRHEAAFKPHDGRTDISFPLALAASLKHPGVAIECEMLAEPPNFITSDQATVELSFYKRGSTAAMFPTLSIRAPIVQVDTLSHEYRWSEENRRALGDLDRILYVHIPDLPRVPELEAATSKVEDIFDPAKEAGFRQLLAGKAVILGHIDELPPSESPSDESVVEGYPRPLSFNEPLLACVEFLFNALEGSGKNEIVAYTSQADVLLLVPSSVVAGVWFGRRIRRVKSRRSLFILTCAFVVVPFAACSVSLLCMAQWNFDWGPFPFVCGFLSASTLAMSVSWLRV